MSGRRLSEGVGTGGDVDERVAAGGAQVQDVAPDALAGDEPGLGEDGQLL